jgi:DNA-binding CsgD family transcriptional regulator
MNNPLFEPLTRREHEILDLLAEGLSARNAK